MSNFLRGFGRTVGLTDNIGDDNVSHTSSYVEVNFLQGANTQGRVPRNAEGDQMIQQKGGGEYNFLQGANTQGRVPQNAEGDQMIQQGGGGEYQFPTQHQGGPQGRGQYAPTHGFGPDPPRGGGWMMHQREGGEHYPPNQQHGGPQGRGMRGVPLTVGNDDERTIQSRLTDGGERDQGLPAGGGQGQQDRGGDNDQQRTTAVQHGGIMAKIKSMSSRNDAATIKRELDW